MSDRLICTNIFVKSSKMVIVPLELGSCGHLLSQFRSEIPGPKFLRAMVRGHVRIVPIDWRVGALWNCLDSVSKLFEKIIFWRRILRGLFPYLTLNFKSFDIIVKKFTGKNCKMARILSRSEDERLVTSQYEHLKVRLAPSCWSLISLDPKIDRFWICVKLFVLQIFANMIEARIW